jgi:hypothetical protein
MAPASVASLHDFALGKFKSLNSIQNPARTGRVHDLFFGSFCYLNKCCNPKIVNVVGVESRVCVRRLVPDLTA